MLIPPPSCCVRSSSTYSTRSSLIGCGTLPRCVLSLLSPFDDDFPPHPARSLPAISCARVVSCLVFLPPAPVVPPELLPVSPLSLFAADHPVCILW